MDNSNQLRPKDYLNATIEAGIGAIPVIGGPIQTLYFGLQNEKRFQRIEKFYELLNKELTLIQRSIPTTVNKNIEEQLIAIIETINLEVEMVRSKDKTRYFINSYKNLLLRVNKNNLDLEELFIDILSSLNKIEIDLLTPLYNDRYSDNGGMLLPKINGTDSSIIYGSMNKLVNHGLVNERDRNLSTLGHDKYAYKISSIGISLCDYILKIPGE